MPKHKSLIVFAVVIAFSFSLIGCGLLASRSDGPDDLAGQGDELPEWLLLAHRGTEGPGSERDDDILDAEDDDAEESDSAVGGSDQDDGVTAPSADQAAPESTQTASAPQSTQPSTSGGSGTTDDSTDSNEEPEFGTKEHLVWLNEQQKAREAEKEAAAEEAAKKESSWSDSFGKGDMSGWQ